MDRLAEQIVDRFLGRQGSATSSQFNQLIDKIDKVDVTADSKRAISEIQKGLEKLEDAVDKLDGSGVERALEYVREASLLADKAARERDGARLDKLLSEMQKALKNAQRLVH